MLVCKTVESSDMLVYARVVLHSAGTEGVHAKIDRVIPRREAREVANDFNFTDFWKALNFVAREIIAEHFDGIHGRNVKWRKFHAALSGCGLFEDQALGLIHMPCGFSDIGSDFFDCQL
jgi:heme oxygenase